MYSEFLQNNTKHAAGTSPIPEKSVNVRKGLRAPLLGVERQKVNAKAEKVYAKAKTELVKGTD